MADAPVLRYGAIRSGASDVKTTVKARNLELSDQLKADIDRKLRRLDRISHQDAEANVELIAHASRANDQSHVAEVTLLNDGSVIRSVAAGSNPLAAIDALLDKLERQVVRSKERPRSGRGRTADATRAITTREATGTLASDEEDTERPGPGIVKMKRFDMLPMFEEDAIHQMEELGHAFFVFLNADTETINVLYRRRNGDYGVIEPVIDDRRKRR
jgi:putative sigma-54 modulation protein